MNKGDRVVIIGPNQEVISTEVTSADDEHVIITIKRSDIMVPVKLPSDITETFGPIPSDIEVESATVEDIDETEISPELDLIEDVDKPFYSPENCEYCPAEAHHMSWDSKNQMFKCPECGAVQ